jgi:hypothetical protein
MSLGIGITLFLVYMAAVIFLDVENYKHTYPVDSPITPILCKRRHLGRRHPKCEDGSFTTSPPLEINASVASEKHSKTTAKNSSSWW